MRCPKCECQDDKVTDSRLSREGTVIRRRRECLGCGFRYTTYEKIEQEDLLVVKRDGRHEAFSREKLYAGIIKACQKRPINSTQIENVVDSVVRELYAGLEGEITSSKLGELVMEHLKTLDPIAYIRFASVYRRFQEVSDFVCAANNFTQPQTLPHEP